MIVLTHNPILYSILDNKLNLLPSIEILAISITFNDSDLAIIGVYRHPNPVYVSSSRFTFHSHQLMLLIGD